jgi:hypothetical protein
MNYVTTPWGVMAARTPEVILKTGQPTFVLVLGLEGKFSAKSRAWEENKIFPEAIGLMFMS